MRIGIAYSSASNVEEAWSGTPSGLARGLIREGHEVWTANVIAPRTLRKGILTWGKALRRSGFSISHSRTALMMNQVAAKRVLRRNSAADGMIILGSDFGVPPARIYATLEDMTVAQAIRLNDPMFGNLTKSTALAWVEAQRRIYERATACCVASAWAARSIIEDYGIPDDKVHVVGFGRNREPLPPARDWSRPRFLFVGKNWSLKNGELVLDAFGEIRRYCPEASLDIVGQDEPLFVDGVRSHGRLSLSNANDRDQLDRLFASATCFVMPSKREAFGIAYVEAGANGIGSIGTSVGGAECAVGTGGILVDPGDRAQLVNAMKQFLDPAYARDVGEAARRHSETFTWPLVGRRIMKALFG